MQLVFGHLLPPLVRYFKVKSFSRPMVKLVFYPLNISIRQGRKVDLLWDILPDQSIEIFITASLPTSVRASEIEIHA